MVDPKRALDNLLESLNAQKNVKIYRQCLPLGQMIMAHPDATMGSAHASVRQRLLVMDFVRLFPTTVTDCINIIKVLKVKNNFLVFVKESIFFKIDNLFSIHFSFENFQMKMAWS